MFAKILEKLLLPRVALLESRMTELERQLKQTLNDANDANERTFRLHQRLVKRAARELEGSDGLNAPQSPITPAEAINERIRLRRQRGKGNGVFASVPGAQ